MGKHFGPLSNTVNVTFLALRLLAQSKGGVLFPVSRCVVIAVACSHDR